MTDVQEAVEAVRLRAIARVHGASPAEADAMSLDDLRSMHAEMQVAAHAAPYWLLDPRAAYESLTGPEMIERDAARIRAAAATAVRVLGVGPLSDAIDEVLDNAACHKPEFSASETSADGFCEEPWGCSTCGCADGVGACDTWQAGIALVRGLDQTTTQTTDSPREPR